MKYLKIQNDGELDIRLVALMGGSTKQNDKYKIGKFGTGLKYTLAYLFRNNIDFRVFVGEEVVNITTENETIANTDFEIVCINDNRTSITTQMGTEWSAWMILRELWCNALDEGGEHRSVIRDIEEAKGETGKTTFYIQITPEIQSVLDNWENYFIHHRRPIWENDYYAIYINDTKEYLRLFKNGVLIFSHPTLKSLFLYDIKNADINELREFKGIVSLSILQALEHPNQDVINYFLDNINEDYYEGSEMDYDWYVTFKDIWVKTIGDRRIAASGTRGYYEDNGVEVNFDNVVELPRKVYTHLTKQWEGLGALVMSDSKSEFFETQKDLNLEDAVEELHSLGYELADGVRLSVGMFSSNKTEISCNKSKKIIMFSEQCEHWKREDILKAIIENNEYIKCSSDKTEKPYYKQLINLYYNQLS